MTALAFAPVALAKSESELTLDEPPFGEGPIPCIRIDPGHIPPVYTVIC